MKLTVTLSNTGDSADAIVILGRGPKKNVDRTLVATELWQAGRAPQVFVSGMTDAPVIIKLGKDMGIPAQHISGERCSQSTWENALFSEILLSTQGIKKILLVTDDAHIARATLTFRGMGFDVVPYPIQSPLFTGQLRSSFRELFGLIFYSMSGKLQKLDPEQDQQERKMAQSKINRWGCSLAPKT
ncbi:MAG: YdcF family protein [Cyanobacteria bacterium P01_D01_bin.156]